MPLDRVISSVLNGGTTVWTIWFVVLIFCIFFQQLYPENHTLTSLVAGALTGVLETLLLYPIENVKIQQQLLCKVGNSNSSPKEKPFSLSSSFGSSSPSSGSSPSTAGMTFWEVAKRTIRLQGYLGLYRGMSPVLFCAVPNQALRWWAFDMICSWTNCMLKGNLLAVTIAGIGSGIVVAVVTGVPVETAKTLSIHQSMVKHHTNMIFASPLDDGEDSDIDILEGTTIQAVTTPTTMYRGEKRNLNTTSNTTAANTNSSTTVVTINTQSISSSPSNNENKQKNKSYFEKPLSPIENTAFTTATPENDTLISSSSINDSDNDNNNGKTNNNNNSMLRGWLPTIIKKVGNQGVRFPVHRATLNFLCADATHSCDGSKHPFFGFIAGAVAGISSIIFTQPVDVVKTRMQGLNSEQYGHSWQAAWKLLNEEGVQVLWTGMGARALRSGLGAGFAFAFFPVMKSMISATPQ